MQVLKGIDVYGGIELEPNIYLVDEELLVDTGTGALFKDMKDIIEKEHLHYKIKNIVNTHCHHDHTGGDKKFRDWLKASIMMHADDKQAVETGQGTLAEMFGDAPKIITVDRALRDGDMIRTTNFEFEVVHTPGHTPGSICLYEKSKRILISGDTLFESGIGRFDLPGGNKDALLDSLDKLLGYNIEFLLPGHGPFKVGGINFLIKQTLAHFEKKQFMNYDYY